MRTRPLTLEDLEDDDVDIHGVVRDGRKLTVPVFMMDSTQRSVALVSSSGAEAAWEEFATTRDAARNACRQELIAIGRGETTPALADAHTAAATARAERGRALLLMRGNNPSPSSRAATIKSNLTADEARAQADASWQAQGERIRNAWKGAA